jgi:hypothetical protein
MNYLILFFLLLLPTSAFSSTLSSLAASLKPGQWAEVSTSNFNGGRGFIGDPNSSCDYTISYTDKMIWDAVTKKLFFLGQSHCNTSYYELAIYDSATNSWSVGATTHTYFGPLGGPSHSYNNMAGVRNGKLYYKLYSSKTIHTYTIATDTWDSTTVPPINMGVNPNCCGQLDYFPERDSLIYVDGDWGIFEYTFSNNTWTNTHRTTVGGGAPMGDYENIGRYNPVTHELAFGGGAISGPGVPNRFYKLSSSNTITRLSDIPSGYTLANSGITSSGILSVDPASGKYLAFLIHGSTSVPAIFTLDSTDASNPWVQQPSSSNPPWFTNSVDGPIFGTAAATIPEYGVMAFLNFENNGQSKLWLYKYAAAAPDTTAPTNPTNLTANVVSSPQVDLRWTASSDNVGVARYDILRCTGTCTPTGTVGTSSIPSFSNTGLSSGTTYSYSVKAFDAAGNVSGASNIVTVTNQPGSTSNFAQRCAAAGVIRCFGFDSTADLGGTYGNNFGRFNNGGACDLDSVTLCPTIDTTVAASGGGSLKFVIPSRSGAGSSGQWFTNFTPDLTQIGQNSHLYIQWQQRFSSVYLNTFYRVGAGWKLAIIGVGDTAGSGCTPQNTIPCAPSCTTNDVVVQNTNLRGFPQMYNSCTGSASHGPYFPFEEGGDFGKGFDIKFQNARLSPYCLYSQGVTNPKTFFSPAGNCFPFVADEWMTFQVHIHTGPWVNGEYQNSHVDLWVSRTGQPSEQIIDFDINISAGSSPGEPFGKIWLLPYHTGKDASQVTDVGYTWYDELIISNQKISDPASSGTPRTPKAPSSLTLK